MFKMVKCFVCDVGDGVDIKVVVEKKKEMIVLD